jgi:hypothetical protein
MKENKTPSPKTIKGRFDEKKRNSVWFFAFCQSPSELLQIVGLNQRKEIDHRKNVTGGLQKAVRP